MAKFVKGDYVQTVPKPDIGWEHWTSDNTDMCNKIVKVVDVDEGGWANDIHIEVEYQGVRVWFGDKHLIKVKRYEDIYSQAIHDAAHKLNEAEKVCKRVRDEILHQVFGEDPPPPKKKNKDVQLVEDELFEDWEEAITDEIIALPGSGGAMTTPPEKEKKKAAAKPKTKRTKSKRKPKIKTRDASQALTSTWTLSDTEIKDLEEYLGTLPNSKPLDTSTTYDYDYEYEHDELD
tara:strand:- start:901 stop:1599 length:699 start_codon:yes stop_codon:yes gene_type:complete